MSFSLLNPYWLPILRLAFPIFLSLLGLQLMEVIDVIMVGKLGVLPLASAAFVNGIANIFMVLGVGFTSSVSVLVARYRGANKTAELANLLHTAFWLNSFFSLFLFIFLLFIRQHLGWFGQSKEVVAISGAYFFWISLSMIPQLFFQLLKQCTDGWGNSMQGSLALLASLGLNFFFNWLLIFGHWGFPAWGLAGGGFATFLARSLLALGYFLYLRTRRDYAPLQLSQLFSALPRHFPHGRTVLGIGIPASLQYLFEVGLFSAATIMAGWISTEALASHQITLKIAATCFMLPLALSFAASIKVGDAIGKSDFALAKNIGFATLSLACFIMFLCGLILWLGRFHIPLVFIEVQSVLEACASLLIITALFQIFDGTQAVAIGVLRGFLDTKIPVAFTFIAYWLISLPSAYWFAFRLEGGIKGLWYGLMLGLGLSSLLLNLRFIFLAHKLARSPVSPALASTSSQHVFLQGILTDEG